jgi:ribosomal protein S24E
MQIINRTENPLLDRVELRFEWNHRNEPTPTLAEMVAAAAKAEPGANRDFVFMKEISTRYGRPLTTGIALIYGSAESASFEPKHIHNRHKGVHSSNDESKGGDE